MTTYELAERLARRLKKGSLTALSMGGAMDVVEAINAGLQEAYELLPAWQRRTTVALDLPAPVTVSIGVTADSVDLSAGAFPSGHIGRSVVVDGDANWNEVQSISKLLDAYRGATGIRSAIVYGDSTYNDLTNFEGLVGHPRFADTREELEHFNARAAGLEGEIGKPVYYWLEPASAPLGATPVVYMRFHPAPDVAYALRCDMEFRPEIMRYASLDTAATIPMQDQLIHRALIPLCEARLLRSPEWANPGVASLVLEDAKAARAMLLNQRSAPGVPNNRVGTPDGY